MHLVDPARLPLRAALDTGVMSRGFWPWAPSFRDDPRTAICHAFVEAMIINKRTLLISAVSIAEALRFPEPRVLPRAEGVEVIAFDAQAAQYFGNSLQDPALQDLKAETGARRPTMTADALIVACAARARAEVIISIDAGFEKVAAKVNLPTRAPDAFLAAQTGLPYVK